MHQSMARKDQTSTRTWPGKIVHPPEHSQERSDVQRIPTNVHPSTQTNLWSIQLAWWYGGAFRSANGCGGLYFLPKDVSMNGKWYLEVLQDHMLLSYEVHGGDLSLQDNAPCHKAKKM